MRMSYSTKRKLLGFTFLIPFLLGFFMFFAKPLFETFKYSFNKITIDEVGNMVFTPNGIQNYIDLFTTEVSTSKTQILRVLMDENTKIYVNPTGRFVVGGPQGDSGLTGRKIIVDTYGGYARHGGGAFSGKDPTKVDRSAAYMARYLAKNVVAAGLADRCEIQLSYAIGVAQPVSVLVDTFGTGRVCDDVIAERLTDIMRLTPSSIIAKLNLRRPLYEGIAAYGHFGENAVDMPWEGTELAEQLTFN